MLTSADAARPASGARLLATLALTCAAMRCNYVDQTVPSRRVDADAAGCLRRCCSKHSPESASTSAHISADAASPACGALLEVMLALTSSVTCCLKRADSSICTRRA
jgi:hypothetical protein